MNPEVLRFSLPIMAKIRECPTLIGTNLYVLWSDLGERDYEKVMLICKNVPNEILEDACNRQDRSGRELIQKYIKA